MKNTNSAAESGAFIRKTRGYSVVQNEALFNDSLSMSAKGLYALIAARIDYTATPLTKQWLMNHCTEGERSFNRAWDMLKNNGYLVAHVRPAKHGRFCYEYELRDSNNGWNGVYEIGCEFARRFLADRFECTVSTHLDKGHLHNHIVVNSVSFMDGRMFRNDFTTYYKGIRAVSDELCRENRLSVVETDGHGKSYGEWKHEKEGAPTLRGMVKADVEMAMASADSFAGFIAELQQMGYKVKYGPKVTHMAVRHKDAQRNIRLDKISPRFSEDALRSYFQELRKLPPAMQQEYKQQTVPHPPRRQPKEQPKPVRRRARYCGKLNYKCRKITGFMAFYYRYCALLRKAYKGKVGKRCYYLLRDDFLKYNRYRRQCDLLWKRQITTLDELLTYKENLQAEYSTLTAQRRALYRGKSKTTPADYSEQIQALTARIRELRREITTCADIEMDCEMVQDKVQRAAHRRENPPRERIHRRAY